MLGAISNANHLCYCVVHLHMSPTVASDLLLGRHRFLYRTPNVPLSEIASVIMFRVPSVHLCERNLDQAVRVSAVLVDFQNFRSNSIALPLGDQVDPDNVVEVACNHTKQFVSKRANPS